MKGLNNEIYIVLLLISNAVAILQLIAALKWPRIARVSFFLLFVWASWTNWRTSQQSPQYYLEYGELAWSGWYRTFISGWFAEHIKLAVGFVATGQALIAISMLLKGWIFKAGCIGGILFLLAILPLGVGSGFPCTAIMAAALYILMRKHSHSYFWKPVKSVAA
jgi:hypothetical protein